MNFILRVWGLDEAERRVIDGSFQIETLYFKYYLVGG